MPNMSESQLRPGGYTRIANLLQPQGPLPLSRSTVWQWIKEGRFLECAPSGGHL